MFLAEYIIQFMSIYRTTYWACKQKFMLQLRTHSFVLRMQLESWTLIYSLGTGVCATSVTLHSQVQLPQKCCGFLDLVTTPPLQLDTSRRRIGSEEETGTPEHLSNSRSIWYSYTILKNNNEFQTLTLILLNIWKPDYVRGGFLNNSVISVYLKPDYGKNIILIIWVKIISKARSIISRGISYLDSSWDSWLPSPCSLPSRTQWRCDQYHCTELG